MMHYQKDAWIASALRTAMSEMFTLGTRYSACKLACNSLLAVCGPRGHPRPGPRAFLGATVTCSQSTRWSPPTAKCLSFHIFCVTDSPVSATVAAPCATAGTHMDTCLLLQDVTRQLSAKEQETAELDAMLEEAHTESESHQAALRDCQDMLEELQTFSQSQESKLHQQHSHLQVGNCLRCCVA